MLIALAVVPGIAAAWLWIARAAAARPAPAARRRRRAAACRRRLAAARRTDPRRQPALDLRHRRQHDPLADLRLQRPRPHRRPGRRAPGARRLQPLRRLHRPAAATERSPRRAGRLAARLRARLRRRDPARLPPAPRRPALRLAACRWRRLPHHRRRLQLRAGSSTPTTSHCSRPSAPRLVGAGFAQFHRARPHARPRRARPRRRCRHRLAVLHDYPSELRWLTPTLILVGALAAALLLVGGARLRLAALAGALALLLLAPATWAIGDARPRHQRHLSAGGPAASRPAGRGAGRPRRGGRPGGLGFTGCASRWVAGGFAGPPRRRHPSRRARPGRPAGGAPALFGKAAAPGGRPASGAAAPATPPRIARRGRPLRRRPRRRHRCSRQPVRSRPARHLRRPRRRHRRLLRP